MRVEIKPEYQIQRINTLLNALDKIRTVPFDKLVKRPHAKAWCVLEVAKHMSIGHKAYQKKIENAFIMASDGAEETSIRTSAVPSFLIKRFPPIDGKVKMKMKTAKKFKPVFDPSTLSEKDAVTILDDLQAVLEELKSWILKYRSLNTTSFKFNSAVGAIVRFNIPEACEFILCHNERHMFQVQKLI